MLKFFKNYWAILVVLVLCFWAVKALFVPGFFPIHDETQIPRLFELDQSLKAGEIPSRWVQDLGFGFGYPLFNFYPPFVYYFGEIFHILGFSFIDSTKIVIFSGFLLSAIFMYLWVKNHFGKFAGILSALLYVYSSYHSVDVYVRGDISEFFAFVWIPAIFWSFDLLLKTKKIRYSIILGLFLAVLVLSHSLTSLPFLFFFIVYLLYFLFVRSKEFKKIFLFIFLSGLIALSFSAFFWLPVFFEKNYTLVDKVNVGELFNYKLHFVCFRQFLDSPWGYGGSLPDCKSGLSFEIGKVHILLSFIATLFIINSFIRKKLSKFKLPLLVIAMLLFSAYMASSHSVWIWDRVKVLSYLQFPWRFLLFSSVFSSFLGGFIVYLINNRFGKTTAFTSVFILGLVTIFLTASDFQPSKFLMVNDSFYTNRTDLNYKYSKISFEFVPKGVATKISDINTTQIDLEKKDIPARPYRIMEGSANVKVVFNYPHSKEFAINSGRRSVIQINTFSFPGWKTLIDGKPVEYSDKNRLKLIVVKIPQGYHILDVNFTNTLPRAVGNAISLVTIFNLIGFGLLKLWKK